MIRPPYISAVLGLVLATAGGGLMLAARTPVSNEWKVLAQPRHPVTPEMWKQADGAMGLQAPEFNAIDTEGQPLSLAELVKGKPLFMYFVLEGCPCSIEVEPFYERLSRQFEGKVNFLAVSNASSDDAKKWKSEFAVPYRVVPDPKLDIMRLYGVTRSVYGLLIGADGKIIRMWPGYNAQMLNELNHEIADAVHEPARKFDTGVAPKIMTSGCEFGSSAG